MAALIERIEFQSRLLGTSSDFLIALPAGARPPLPAVLLFRAAPGEWLDPQQDEHRSGRNLLTVMQDLIHKGYSRPLAFVLPRTANYAGSAFVAHGRALCPDLIPDPEGLGLADMDAFIDRELIPKALATGLITDRLSLDGFSLGGAAALAHALRRPERFASVACFDGAFLDWDFDNPLVSPDTPSDLRLDDFAYLYGFPPDEAAFRAGNVLDRLQRPFSLPPTMIHYAAAEHPTANGWRVREVLKRVRNQAEVPFMHPASAHTWYWADEHLYRSLPFHARHLYGEGSRE